MGSSKLQLSRKIYKIFLNYRYFFMWCKNNRELSEINCRNRNTWQIEVKRDLTLMVLLWSRLVIVIGLSGVQFKEGIRQTISKSDDLEADLKLGAQLLPELYGTKVQLLITHIKNKILKLKQRTSFEQESE